MFRFLAARLIATESNRCTFLISCTGVSWKGPFLCIMRNFKHSLLTEMRILIGHVVHRGRKITRKMSYLRYIWFSFCKGYLVKTRRHYRAGLTALHIFHGDYSTLVLGVHIHHKWNFCQENLLPVWGQFDHLAAPLGFRSIVHRV